VLPEKLVKFEPPITGDFMSIFDSKFRNKSPLKDGEYAAEVIHMDLKETKAGDPMLIVEFQLQSGKVGKAQFPQVNPFFEDEAKRACEVLLGVAEPEDIETFFRLADQAADRLQEFKLVVKSHQKSTGETTQNFLIRSMNESVWDNSEAEGSIRRSQHDRTRQSRRSERRIEKLFEPSWSE
jgi:hypothetical protein